MGDPKTGKPGEQGPEFVDEPFGDSEKQNVPGDQDTTPPDENPPEEQAGG